MFWLLMNMWYKEPPISQVSGTNHIHRLRGNWQEDTRSMNGGKLCLEFLMICFLHMFLCQIVTFPILVKEGVNLVSGWH